MNYVIGNIEGHYSLFVSLLEQAGFSANDKLYILGDFIGDTYESIKCVDYIKKNTLRKNFIPILGCQEEEFLLALHYGDIRAEEKLWKQKGIIAQYHANSKLKNSHMKFFSRLPKYVETEEFIFSHIGAKIPENENIKTYLGKNPNLFKEDKKHFFSHYCVNH